MADGQQRKLSPEDAALAKARQIAVGAAKRALLGHLWPVLLAALVVVVLFGAMLAIFAKAKSEAAERAACGTLATAVLAPGDAVPPSPAAQREVPQRLMPLYLEAATRHRLGPEGWTFLAAINKTETSFGTNLNTSSAGAIGWMQFMPATWTQYGADLNGDGVADPYDPREAINAAASYLRASGAPADWHRAIFAYNHSESYVATITADAHRYAGTGAPSPTAPVADDIGGACSCPSTTAAASTGAPPDAHGGPGFTPAPGTDFAFGDEPEIARRADALGKALNIALTGISGHRSPTHNQAVGGSRTSQHLTGQAADIDGIEQVPEAVLNRYGLHRPINGTWVSPTDGQVHDERNHIELASGGPDAAAGDAQPAACGSAAPLGSGEKARLSADGTAIAPADAPPAVLAMVAAGNRLLGQPYHYGGGHGSSLARLSPDGYDCSAAVSYLLHAAGLLGTSSLDSTALMSFGDAEAGRWVTVYASRAHAFVVVAGLRMDTSRVDDSGPARTASGPRWRTWPRSTKTFDARHPGGL
jgi:cell wall-associated NlpC family hydrolase